MLLQLRALIASLLFVGMAIGIAGAEQPSIVLFYVDDLGQRDLGVYGSDFHETPHMDRLAAEGMLFDRAYSAYPRCTPSRQGLLSGKYPCRLDQNRGDHALPLSEVTFAESLKEAGYQTAYMGKWHLGKEGGTPSFQGFDTTIHAGAPGAPKSYFFPFPMEHGAVIENPIVDGKEGDYLTDRLTDMAVSFIKENKSGPFLLVVAHYVVHTPFEAPDKTVSYFRKKLKTMGRVPGGGKRDLDLVTDRESKTKTQQNNPVYAAMVKHTDDSLGRIVETLKTSGIDDNTIVILSSDHGGLSSRSKTGGRPLATTNFPFRQGKGSIFEGGTRVPLIVRWPKKIRAGSKSSVQVTGTDHYPTFLQLAGSQLRPQQHLDGQSYLPALKGEVYQRKEMFWYKWMARPDSTGDTQAISLIDGDYKLIEWWSEGKVELFNLAADLGEQEDLSEQQPEITKRMLSELHAKEEAIGNLRRKGKGYLERRLARAQNKSRNRKKGKED